MAILTANGIKKSFGDTQVLRGIDLEVEKGEVISILGPSGGGKTTFLRCLNFLEQADSGTLTFLDETVELAKANKKQIRAIRMHTGFVFQNYNLFLNKTALENVTEGLITARKMKKEEAVKKAEAALLKVGLSDKADAYPNQLSGGQQQRVAIARALATDPAILYFDEPTSALDPELTKEVLAVMRDLAKEGMTMVVVTHEVGFARQISTKAVFMENGVVVEAGAAPEFFDAPKTERTKEFLRSMSSKDV
ncbi:MAG: amino acid ABC transporter ATP-binding protein [Lachnospiraceae bacterium]|nr:amino acid ABC transporter ATP-binding protein [Lachnospiraceae bacterium]